jgi:prepilin-type N-terminal cleavage/methylation domain-containing protein/prepilin-type processing-associated H-X9-DG protein
MFVTFKKQKKSGFTLVELLVVIAIIALLLSILMPSLQKAKELAKQVVCGSRQKQLGLAVMTYSNDYDGWVMPGYDCLYIKGATTQQQTWKSPADLDPTIKIADHKWYGILWAAKGMDNRDVFFCPSLPPSSNKQFGDAVKDSDGKPVNIEESSMGWTYGMRAWAIRDAKLTEWVNWQAPKRLTSIKKPSDFFLLADSANPAGLVGTTHADFKGSKFAQVYTIVDVGRAENWTSWKPCLHLRHSDKVGAVFADGHAEFKPMPFWCDMQAQDGWQAKYDIDQSKPGYVVYDAGLKNRWSLIGGKYILQPLSRTWAPLTGK